MNLQQIAQLGRLAAMEKMAEQQYRHPALNRINIPGPGLRTFEDNIVRKALPEGLSYYHNPIRNKFDNLEDALEAKPETYYTWDASEPPETRTYKSTPRSAAEDVNAQRDIAELHTYPWDLSRVDVRNDYSPAGLRDRMHNISPWWNNQVIRPAKIQYDRTLGRYGKSYQAKEQLRKDLEEVDATHAATTERAWNTPLIRYRGHRPYNHGGMIPEKPDPTSLNELSRQSVKSMGYDQPASPHGNIPRN